MKLFGIQFSDGRENINFGSTRVLKNTVSQLAKNNKYSLSEPNQRNIANSIAELGKIAGGKNINFLLNTAAKTVYNTNIKLTDSPKNNWVAMLLAAASTALAITPLVNKTEFVKRIQELSKPKELSDDEKEILSEREKLINSVDIEQIKKETVGGIKDFQKNLDYFIVSSETTVAHKKYVLKRLNYFMSDKYKINPQLKNKKSIAAAEMINDMAIFTPGHKIPNIKAVNQKNHGMCAAISIVRKKLAYEDKPNYIDSIISELDDSDFIKVYDRSKLGSGKKIHLKKIQVDFDDALSKGYRIIDASTTQWMNLANMSGYSGNTFNYYNSFDKDNFDVKTDAFFNAKFEDPNLRTLQEYYQALLKTGTLLENYKANKIEKNILEKNVRIGFNDKIKKIKEISNLLANKLGSNKLAFDVLNLRYKFSDQIGKDNPFAYIDNEEEIVKKNKIKNYILSINPDVLINDELLNSIYDLTEFYHSLNDKNVPHKTRNSDITNAKELYNIAAGNRYQFVKGLEDEINLKIMMLEEHIPYKELQMEQIIDSYISKIKNNSADSGIILDGLSRNLNGALLDKKTALTMLREIKQEFNHLVTVEFNNFYKAINLKNQKNAFVSYLRLLEYNIINGNEEVILDTADRLNVPNESEEIISAIDNMIKQINKGGKAEFDNAFNIMGNTSKIKFLISLFNNFKENISSEDNDDFIENFIKANNLNLNENTNAVQDKINELEEFVLIAQQILDSYTELLAITDKNGNIIYSPNPEDIIIKRLENNGIITSEKDLKELKTHLDKIQKDRSSDEFNSRQGKLKDNSLYKFSPSEKAALKVIKQNINSIYRYVQKKLSYLETYLKYPLEELKRMVGLDMGHWWVHKEGGSGLYTGQEIRILEYITGRPHYATENLEKAIEEIKTSPYSGISSSSVFHDKPGYHAQYIADITPVKINVTKPNGEIKKETADVLFQDNTWGASEHENTWVDSNGFVRTDYSDHRGGTLGYITNEMYRNGNLVHRVLGDMILEEEPVVINNRIYKKIVKPNPEGYKAPQYSEIILDGKSPEARDIAKSIHDTVFVPSINQISTIKLFTKNLKEEELKNKINTLRYTAANWGENFNDIMTRILSEDFIKAIQTKEDYDKLPDNDPVKVKLEKAALKKNYKIDDLSPAIANINNVRDLEHFRNIQKQRAIKNFKYSFGKNPDIVTYILNSINNSDTDTGKIDDILKKYGIELTDEEFDKMLNVGKIKPSDLNGSVKQTLHLLLDNLAVSIRGVVNNPDAQNEIINYMQHLMAKKVYFTTSDIEDRKIKRLIEFIDRIYNPDDNAALARIFRKLQNMTTKEFEKEVIPQITDEELGIKQYTGYDILKHIQRYESDFESNLRNAVWADELYLSTNPPKLSIKYENHKLYRRPQTIQTYNFDTSYREMKNDLSLLNLEKLFDKYKDRNFNKYHVYPAYPRIEYLPADVLQYGFDTCIQEIPKHIEHIKTEKNLVQYFELSDTLKALTYDIPNTARLTEQQLNIINHVLNQIVEKIYNDDSQIDVYKAALKALKVKEGSSFNTYKKYLNQITEKIDLLKENCPVEDLNKDIESEKLIINKLSEMFIKTCIRSRYQSNVYSTLQNYKQSLIKDSITSDGQSLAEIYKEQLWEEYTKYYILREPEEVLEKYVLSLAEDSPLHEYSNSFENLLHRALGFSMLHDVQSILMDALRNGIETDVKKAFNNIQIEFSDGTSVPMSSSSIIFNMVSSLILDEQEETALLFLDKFGLNEEFVEYTVNNFNYDELKNIIDDSRKMHKNHNLFAKKYQEVMLTTYNSLKEGYDPVKTANILKKQFVSIAKQCHLGKDDTKTFTSAIEYIKEYLSNNTVLQPEEIFNMILSKASKELETSQQGNFEAINNSLLTYQTVANLMNKINLMQKSPATKMRDEFNNKFQDLVKYNNKIYQDLQEEE